MCVPPVVVALFWGSDGGGLSWLWMTSERFVCPPSLLSPFGDSDGGGFSWAWMASERFVCPPSLLSPVWGQRRRWAFVGYG